MATTFPGQVQEFPTMYDISASDAALVAQYQAAMQAGDFDTAQSILSSIPLAEQKIVTADLLNQILDTTVAVENYFLQRYSNGYIVSPVQPAGQSTGDFWFQITGTVS